MKLYLFEDGYGAVRGKEKVGRSVVFETGDEREGVLYLGGGRYRIEHGCAEVPESHIEDGTSKIAVKSGERFFICGDLIRDGDMIRNAYDADELAVRNAKRLEKIAGEMEKMSQRISNIEKEYGIHII